MTRPRTRGEGNGAIHLRMLDIPVKISCPTADVQERIRLCYAPCLSDPAVHGALLSEIVPARNACFTVSVEGQGTWRAKGLIDAVRMLNHELLHALMKRAPQNFYVHAGVVAREGRAIVLPGLSRAGKSTLVLALISAGARFLSDEILAFDADVGLIRAYPRAIKIRDECLEYFPEYREQFVGSGEGRFLPFSALSNVTIQLAAVPAVIVAPTWQPAAPERLAPLSAGEALLGLAASALNFGTHRARSLDHLHALCRGIEAFELSWRNPRRAADLILEGALGAQS